MLAEKWNSAIRNIASSFQTRLVLDLLSGVPSNRGFFVASLSGRQLGNFDILHDPQAQEQITVGQVAFRNDRAFFDVWTSFQARAFRQHTRKLSSEFILSDFRIDATLELDLMLRAKTRVKLKPESGEMRVLPFEISNGMTITAATVNGRPAEVLQRESLRSSLVVNTGNDLFLLVAEEPLKPAREYEIEFQHEGRVIRDAGNGVYYVGARGNWYPNRRTQFAHYELTFRYPRDLDLVTPGEVVEDRSEDQWRITRRRTGVPVRMATFNLGRYQSATVTRGPYMVEVYANRTLEHALAPRLREPVVVVPPAWPRNRRPEVLTLPSVLPPPSPTSRLADLAGDIGSALEFMSAHFGPPALRLLKVSPVPGRFGQGFPGLIYLSTLSYLDSSAKPVSAMNQRVQFFFSEVLQAHETAHQWWGNVVTSAGYHDDWLLEALANYSALLYLEKRKGVRSLEATLSDYKEQLLAEMEKGGSIDSVGPIILGTRLESSQTPNAWNAITYGKGSWIMHMLRRRMGDSKFLAMLGELRRRYQSQPISTQDFRSLAVEFLPPGSPDPKLENFFDQWVYGTGIPELTMRYTVKGKPGALQLAGEISQSGTHDDFSIAVPVEIQFATGKPTTHWVHTGPQSAAFSIALKRRPTKVLLDPGWSVLRR